MKTYKCDFKTYYPDDKLAYKKLDFKFRTRDVDEYIKRTIKRYEKHNMRAEFTNIKEII